MPYDPAHPNIQFLRDPLYHVGQDVWNWDEPGVITEVRHYSDYYVYRWASKRYWRSRAHPWRYEGHLVWEGQLTLEKRIPTWR